MKYLLVLVSVLCTINRTFADPAVLGFTFFGNVTYQGKIIIEPNLQSTNYGVLLAISRGQMLSNGTYVDEPVEMTFEIIAQNDFGDSHTLFTKNITTSDFNGSFLSDAASQIAFSIPAAYYSYKIVVRSRFKHLDPTFPTIYGKLTDYSTYVSYATITPEEVAAAEMVPPTKDDLPSRWQSGAYLAIPGELLGTKIIVGQPNSALTSGQSIQSPNGQYSLELQTDGNLVLRRTSDWRPIWDTGTAKSGATNLIFQNDGNLVLRNPSGDPKWSAGTSISRTDPKFKFAKWACFILQNDGNFTMYFPIQGDAAYRLRFSTRTSGGVDSPVDGHLE